jgi:transmembrane sensor
MTLHGRAEEIEMEAAIWLAGRLSTSQDPAKEADFCAWLEADTAHRIAYLRVESAWKRAAQLKVLKSGSDSAHVPLSVVDLIDTAGGDVKPSLPRRTSIGSRWIWALAASVVAIALGIGWRLSNAGGDLYSTGLGETLPLVLEDGTHLTLNTETRVRVLKSARRRAVYLEQGEAIFSVAKDPARPFVVHVGGYRITDLGTRFSVRTLTAQSRVSVIEGRVRINKEGLLAFGPWGEYSDGGQITIDHDELKFATLSPDETARQTSWTEGYLEFRDSPLRDAIEQFNRYHAEKMLIEDNRLDEIRLGGRFKYADLDGFLALLQRGFPVTASRDGDRILLRRR